jgi:hypothetical protein
VSYTAKKPRSSATTARAKGGQIATRPLDSQGTAELVEISTAVRSFQQALQADGLSAYRNDRIHLNAWGQT